MNSSIVEVPKNLVRLPDSMVKRTARFYKVAYNEDGDKFTFKGDMKNIMHVINEIHRSAILIRNKDYFVVRESLTEAHLAVNFKDAPTSAVAKNLASRAGVKLHYKGKDYMEFIGGKSELKSLASMLKSYSTIKHSSIMEDNKVVELEVEDAAAVATTTTAAVANPTLPLKLKEDLEEEKAKALAAYKKAKAEYLQNKTYENWMNFVDAKSLCMSLGVRI